MSTTPTFIFFGTPDRAVWTLARLKELGLVPSLVVTQPDKPQGRKLVVTPPPAKVWAEKESIPVVQPEDVSDAAFLATLKAVAPDFFVVVAYGKILPASLLQIPTHGALNLHGSLLPKLRGSSPIETAILEDIKETGPTIILMDEKMDHGPIVLQEKIEVADWPPYADELAKKVVTRGAELLAESMKGIAEDSITPQEQNHSEATYTRKIKKEDGLINLSDDSYLNYRKYKAYKGWPGVFFFKEEGGKQVRMKITGATFENGEFKILKVIPEGKKEILFS